jgi:hypothetical protein
MTSRPGLFLKRSLLFFWAVWLSVVLATNVLDGCKALGWPGEGWSFASGNYRLLAETTARYGTPAWVNGALFLGVIAWEGAAALLFWLAWLRFRGREEGRRTVYAAFTLGLGLWSAFAVADEIFLSYALEGTHLRLFTAQLATLLAVELLPDRPAGGSGRT